MMPQTKKSLAGMTALLLLLVAGASLAWACTYNPRIDMDPSFGPPGGEVNAKGVGFRAGTLVEIRWNAPTGLLLGKAITNEKNQFSVSVVIPERDSQSQNNVGLGGPGGGGPGDPATNPGPGGGNGGAESRLSEGVYYVVAVVAGSVDATTSFEVRYPKQTNTTNSPTGEGQVSGTTNSPGSNSQVTGGNTSSTVAGGSEVPQSQLQPGVPASSAESHRSASPVSSVPSATTSAANQSQGAAPASSRAAAVTLSDGRAVFGGSLPSARTVSGVSGDLWSGFKAQPPSLVPSFADGSGRNEGSPGMAIAMGLAGLAAAGTLTGFLAAEVGRRRKAERLAGKR